MGRQGRSWCRSVEGCSSAARADACGPSCPKLCRMEVQVLRLPFIRFPSRPEGTGAARIPRCARQASRPRGRGAPPSAQISQYNAEGTVHPRGGKDESSQPRTMPSPCNLCLGPFEPATSTLTNDSLPATRLLRSERHRTRESDFGVHLPAVWAEGAGRWPRRFIKETNHAIRHHDRLDSSRGRRVRAAESQGIGGNPPPSGERSTGHFPWRARQR